MTYPEHEKLNVIRDKSQAVADFLEWCDEKGLHLGHWSTDPHDNHFWPAHIPLNNLLADFFGINLKVLEKEKQAMLDEIRAKP